MDAGFAQDIATRKTIESLGIPITTLADTVIPSMTSVNNRLELGTGVLTIRFDETLDVTVGDGGSHQMRAVNLNKMFLVNSSGIVMDLGGALTLNVVEDDRGLRILLNETQRIFGVSSAATVARGGDSIAMTMVLHANAVTDVTGNANGEQVDIKLIEIVDSILPTFGTPAFIDLNAGEIVITASETMDFQGNAASDRFVDPSKYDLSLILLTDNSNLNNPNSIVGMNSRSMTLEGAQVIARQNVGAPSTITIKLTEVQRVAAVECSSNLPRLGAKASLTIQAGVAKDVSLLLSTTADGGTTPDTVVLQEIPDTVPPTLISGVIDYSTGLLTVTTSEMLGSASGTAGETLALGRHAVPSFLDADGDGDQDLFIGIERGEIVYLENMGTASNPFFQHETAKTFANNQVAQGFFSAGADVTVATQAASGFSNIKFLNLDNGGVPLDSDLDMVMGEADGTLRYFQNDGNNVFTELTTTCAQAPPAVQTNCNPFTFQTKTGLEFAAIAAMTLSGQSSFAVGTSSGYIRYIKNNNRGANPVLYDWNDPASTGANKLTDDVGERATVATGNLYQLSCGTGLCREDVLVGTAAGLIVTYRIDNSFTVHTQTGASNPARTVDVSSRGGYAAPALADLDGDLDLDLVVGAADGTLHYYENIGTTTSPDFTSRDPIVYDQTSLSQQSPFTGLSLTRISLDNNDAPSTDGPKIDITVSSAVPVSQDYNVLNITLTKTLLSQAILISGTPGGDGSASYLRIQPLGVRDVALNYITTELSVLLTEIPDTVPPILIRAEIKYSEGILLIVLDEYVGYNVSAGNDPTYAMVNLPLLSLTDVSGARHIPLTGAYIQPQVNTSLYITLTEAQRVDAIEYSGTTGGDGSSVFLDVLQGGLTDLAGNFIEETLGVVVSEAADEIIPIFLSGKLEYASGLLSVTAQETIDASSIDTSKIFISDVSGQKNIQLTGTSLVGNAEWIINVRGDEWTLGITAQGITESAGVTVTQGAVTGTLKTALSNEITLAIINTPTIAETAGVTVSQGGVYKGTLKTTLSGEATSVVVEVASGVTILTNADVTIGSTLLLQGNINTATNTGATTSVVVKTTPGLTFLNNVNILIGTAPSTCVPASTNGACSSVLAPANQAACDSQSVGTCAGGGGAECISVANGPEATCVATMDDTAGGATPCVWTSTNLCMYSALIITENAGVTVRQNTASGTLKTALTGEGMTSVVIQAAVGVTFVNGLEVTIGESTVTFDKVSSATNDFSNIGTLKTTLTGADMTSIVITAAAGVSFVTGADVVIGTGSTATTITYATLNTVTNSQSALGTLVAELNGDTTSLNIFTGSTSATFVTSADLVVGSTTVVFANVKTATQTTGILKTALTGDTTSVVIQTASGIIFFDNRDLLITTASGFETVAHTNVNSAINNGATTNVVIQTVSGVTFKNTANLVIGDTNVHFDDITTANGDPNRNAVIQTTSGIQFVNDADLIIGNTRIDFTNIYTAINNGASTRIVILTASGSSEVDCKNCARDRRSNAVASPVAECENCFSTTTDLTIGNTKVGFSNITTATNNGATTRTVVETASGVSFVTQSEAEGDNLMIGNTEVAIKEITKAINKGATTTVIIETASGIIFDKDTEIMIGSTLVEVANLNSVENTGATDSVIIQTAFSASSPVQFFTTVNLAFIGPNGRYTVYADKILTAVNSKPNTGLTQETQCTQCSTGLYSITLASDAATDCKVCVAGKFNENMGAGDVSLCLSCPAGYSQDTPGQSFCLPCTPGRHQDVSSEIDCKDCARGRRSNAVASPVAECEKCSIGQFQPSVKSTFCANCRPGSYQNVIGQEECFDCWKGRFASDEGRHNCTNCDVGKTAIANGSTVCNDCDPGTYGKGTSCWACPSGYKRHEDDPTTSCLHCPQGTDTENRPNAVQCTPCTFGWYGFSKGVCARCQEGTFQDTSGESTCKACENGVANKAKSACDKCTQGKRGRNITEILSQKLFSKRAGEDDEDANKRETELNEKRYCVQCERGQFNDLLGQSNCQYCANSRKDQPNIKQTACELKPYKQADDCNEDEYLNASYYTDEPPYFGKEKWKCMLCPLGGDCKNASTTLATIRSSNGWWRIPNDYTPTCQTTLPAECNRTETDEKGVEKCIEYIPVPSDDACIQWTLFANCNPIQNCIPAGAGPNETQCREGTDPSVDLCSKCLPGYNRQGPYCVQCTAGDTAIRGSMMLIVLGLLGVLAAKNKERLEKLGKKYQQAFKDGMLAFKIIMSFMQVQQSMGSSLGGQFQFPEIYVDFLANFDIVNMDPINMMGASCVGKVDFRMTLTIGLGFVSSIVVIGAIVYIFGKHSIHNKAHDLSDENKRLFMGKLFDLSDFDESGEIESFELFLLFDFVADREFEKGVLQDQVDILKEDQDRLLVIMINAGAHESENEFGKYKLLRHKFIEATFKKHDARKDQFKELSHFVPIVQAIEQVKEQELLANVMSSIIQLFLMIHTPIAMKAFQYFDCHDLGEDKRKLRADYELDCDSPEYDEYLPVAYTLLFGFALSLPLFVGWILFSHRHSLDSPSTRASIGFLYSRFHWPYWDVFNVIRKISLVGILLFIPGNIRAVSALLICMFGCCTLNFFQPQRNVVVFWISQAAFLMITVKYLVVIFAMTDLDIDQMEALGYVLMGCDIFILLGTVFSFLAIYFLMRRSIQKINAMELKEKLEADARKKELMANGEWDEKANKRRKTREQRGLSFKNRKFLKRAVTASQATDIQENSLIYKKTALKKIRIRLRESDKRLRKRLAPRRKKLAKNLKRINRKKQVHPTDQESLSANEIVLSGDGDRDQNEEDEEEKMDNQLTKDVERVRQLIKKMIKSEKRLIAIMNMLDDDKSGKLSHPEFSNLVLKVLKKSHDVNASPELLDAVWEDVRVNRKHEADEEICEDTLNFWLGFEDNAMDGDPMAAKDAAALKTYIEVEAAHDPLELQANKMILTMVKMLKNRGRLAGLFKMLGVTDLMNITKEYFIKFCEKIIKKQDEITDLTEELLAELWSLAKDHDQNNDKLSTVISDMSLCIWLGFEKAPVVSESPTTKDKQTASSSDSAATEKIRLLMRKMVKSEKRLLGIIKMIDLDASGKLSESEFGKLVQKVLKKQKEIVTGPGLMSMVWNELLNNRQDMKQNEIGSYELCTWLELEMNRPPRSTETPASANEDTALGEDTALAHTLNAEKVRLQIKLMVKDSTRLLGLIKMVGGDAKNFNQTSFVKLTQKVFKKQKEIVPSPELLASVWEIVKSKRKEPFVHPEVGINELCSYLDLEPADKPPVVAAATEKQDGGDSGSSGDLKENAEKLRTQMKKMIKDGKRLLGIIKMIDGDGSGRLNESEFNKLCKKVLKKQKEVVTSPELLAICWGDVQKLRQDKSKIEIGDFELCSYLDLEPADKPPVVAAATKKDDDGNVEKMRLSMCKAVKTGKRLFSIIKMIDGDGSGRLDESEFNKLCKKVLKKQKEIVASPELLKQTWEEVKKHRKDMAQEEIGQAELSAFLGLK